MKKLIWCSPHVPTQEQIQELTNIGEIIFLKDVNLDLQKRLENTPDDAEMAEELAWDFLAYLDSKFYNYAVVQPAGNPMFQYILGAINGIREEKTDVYYAYSVRESAEEKQPDGSVKKVAIFKHKCFIKV